MRLLKPLDSWPAFAVEILVIVVGVLIALSAEQVVQRLNWQAEVREARGSLDAQLLESQRAALERLAKSDCHARKLDRLDDLIAGGSIPPIDLSAFGSLRVWGTSAWDAATASGAVAHMTPEVRSRYSDLFAFTAVIGEMNRQEFQTGADLKTIERHRELTETSRDRLARNVSSLREQNSLMTLGARQWLEGAKPLRLELKEADRKYLQKIRSKPCRLPDDPSQV